MTSTRAPSAASWKTYSIPYCYQDATGLRNRKRIHWKPRMLVRWRPLLPTSTFSTSTCSRAGNVTFPHAGLMADLCAFSARKKSPSLLSASHRACARSGGRWCASEYACVCYRYSQRKPRIQGHRDPVLRQEQRRRKIASQTTRTVGTENALSLMT